MEQTDTTTARAQARVGSLLNGRWHLDQLVGVGGMAAVYAATHRNGKRVAIKILHPEISADDNARQRFLREGYAANQVGHRGAVTADDDGLTEDGVAFLVMELLEGETIEERSVRLGGTLKAREVLTLMDQALATLEAAHAKHIVHRDLKPENLFLTREGIVKVLDFGIARVLDRSGSPSQTQGVMGTPSFMAPEQARGRWQDVDERTDLWAIGATMFALLSGRFVHMAETANEALVAAVTERAPSLGGVAPHVHPAVVALVDKVLSYERELRFQTATEFRAALQAADAEIAGDEASPSLRVPLQRSASIVQAGPLALTVEGMASSVRGAQTNPSLGMKPGIKALVVLSSLAAGALFVFLGRGLFVSAGNRTTLASRPHVSAAALVAPGPKVEPAGPAVPLPVSVPALAPAREVTPGSPAARSPAKPHSSSARVATNPPGLATPKPAAAKTAAELLKKRH
ncbi:MAG: serine/threonine-protein kinase [Myxococcales bacterium]